MNDIITAMNYSKKPTAQTEQSPVTPPADLSSRPTIVKYTQSSHNGIQIIPLYRHAIGFLLKGRMYLYDGDIRREAVAGDMYYLALGSHYVEYIPEGNRPFEQIVLYYDTRQLSRILNHLGLSYRIPIRNDHECPKCRARRNVIYPAWNTIRHFFGAINHYLKEDLFGKDRAAEDLLLTQLVYLLNRNEQCCLNPKILDSVDNESAEFERIVYDHIFKNISIEELARICNRSLTAFKKDFKRHFHDSPHRWFVQQRLMQGALMLISTGKSVSQIGVDCIFPNTSHFIKLFKKQFGVTPVVYRQREKKQKRIAEPAGKK